MNRQMEILYTDWEENRQITAEERFQDRVITDQLEQEDMKEAFSQYVVKNMEAAFVGGFQAAMNLMLNIR